MSFSKGRLDQTSHHFFSVSLFFHQGLHVFWILVRGILSASPSLLCFIFCWLILMHAWVLDYSEGALLSIILTFSSLHLWSLKHAYVLDYSEGILLSITITFSSLNLWSLRCACVIDYSECDLLSIILTFSFLNLWSLRHECVLDYNEGVLLFLDNLFYIYYSMYL